MIIVLHSSGNSGGGKRLADHFTCVLPHELSFSAHRHYKVALLKLMCDNIVVFGFQGAEHKDIVHVILRQADPLHCRNQVLSTHVIEHEVAPNKSTWGYEYSQAGNVHVFEAKHKKFYPLISNQITSFEVILRDTLFRRLYRKSQAVTSTTVVLEIKEMEDFNKQEIVPLTLSSPATAEYPNNTPSMFSVKIPPRFYNQTGRPWYVALGSVTYPILFPLFPGHLKRDQVIRIVRNLGDRVNQLDYVPVEKDKLGMYKVEELGGSIVYEWSLDKLEHVTNKLELIRELRAMLQWRPLKKKGDKGPQIGISINDDHDAGAAFESQKEVKIRFFSKQEDYDDSDVEMCYCLAVLLGLVKFDPRIAANDYVKIPMNQDFMQPIHFDTWYHPRKLFFYANFVEPSINGSVLSPLLAVVPVQNVIRHNFPTLKKFSTYEATQLTYRRLNTQNLSECKIEVRDEFGQLIRFKNADETYVFLDLFIQVNK